MCRCVEEYNKDTKLDHIPDILSGRSEDDKIHQSYHEIVMSDLDIDKLVSLVTRSSSSDLATNVKFKFKFITISFFVNINLLLPQGSNLFMVD